MISMQVLGAERVAAKLEQLGRGVDAAEKQVAIKGSLLVRKLLVARMSGRATRDPFWGKGSPLGEFLGARSGQTRARVSPGGVAVKAGGRWQASVGSPDAYVRMHDQGGTVSGRQYLRIPTAAAQTAGGQDRNAGRSLRTIPGLFLFRSRAGNLWAAINAPNEGLSLLYLLVRSVKVRARHFFGAVEREAAPLIAELGAGEVSIVVKAAQ